MDDNSEKRRATEDVWRVLVMLKFLGLIVLTSIFYAVGFVVGDNQMMEQAAVLCVLAIVGLCALLFFWKRRRPSPIVDDPE